MFGFQLIASQKLPLKILTAILKKKNIPHALLFLGIEGVGQETAAITFAMACNCIYREQISFPNDLSGQSYADPGRTSKPAVKIPCGTCRSCKKILSDNHPDIVHIRPSAVQIKISQIRELARTLSLKPYEADQRIIIIHNAHLLNPAAGNALLKLLEEPPDRTMFILIATQKSDVLPTIASRCQHIRFNPIPVHHLSEILVTEHHASKEEAQRIAAVAGGSLSRAVNMKQSGWLAYRKWILKTLVSIASQPLALNLALAEKVSKNKETLLLSMEIVLYWLRDVLIIRHDPKKIVNDDFADEIRFIAEQKHANDVLQMIKNAESIQKKIPTNINIRLVTEIFMLQLSEMN